MSRRVTNQLDITDRDLAKDALRLAGCEFSERGTTLFVTSGSLRNATLELSTGTLSGDEDFGHSAAEFGVLRQFYTEARVRQECAKNGTMIDERLTDDEGSVILMWSMA